MMGVTFTIGGTFTTGGRLPGLADRGGGNCASVQRCRFAAPYLLTHHVQDGWGGGRRGCECRPLSL
jgi:hypothetical protein